MGGPAVAGPPAKQEVNMLGQLTTYETEFKKQLDAQTAALKKVSGSSALTMYRRQLADWYASAVKLYLKGPPLSPKYAPVLKEFQALIPNMNSWYDNSGWSACKDKALPVMGLISGIMAVPATDVKVIEKIVTQVKVEEKIVNVPGPTVTVTKTNWKTIGIVGSVIAIGAFAVAKFAGKKKG